jgi:hypothetical protein
MLDSTLLDKLARWPVLQSAAAFLLLLLGSLITWRTLVQPAPPPKDPAPQPPVPPGGAAEGAHVYFQGPLQRIDERLAGMQAMLERLSALHYETREQTAVGLQLTRHDVRSILQELVSDSEREGGEIKTVLRDIERGLNDLAGNFGRLDEFVRARVK